MSSTQLLAEEITEKVRLDIVNIIATTKVLLADQEMYLSRWTTMRDLMAEKHRLQREPTFENWKLLLELQPKLDAFAETFSTDQQALARVSVWKIIQKFIEHPEAVSCVEVNADADILEFNPLKTATADPGPLSSSSAPLAK